MSNTNRTRSGTIATLRAFLPATSRPNESTGEESPFFGATPQARLTKRRKTVQNVFAPGNNDTPGESSSQQLDPSSSIPEDGEVSQGARARQGVSNKTRTIFGRGAGFPTEELFKEKKRELGELGLLDGIAEQIVFQAGLDGETGTRPLVVVCGCALPNKSYVDTSRVIERVVRRMDIWWEEDYELLVLANPTPHPPSLALLTRTYWSLPRSSKKNVKRIYILGNWQDRGSWLKMISTILLTSILSPKTARKISRSSSLSELAAQGVPINQVEFPPAVYEANHLIEASVTLPASMKTKLQSEKQFGVPIEKAMATNEGKLPRVLVASMAFIREEGGLEKPGVFRRSPKASLLRCVGEAFDRGNPIQLGEFNEPVFVASSLIKMYIAKLPTPIFPRSTYDIFENCPPILFDGSDNLEAIDYLRRKLLPKLDPPENLVLLSSVFQLLHEVQLRKDVNLMDSHNLASVFCPILIRSNDLKEDSRQCIVPGLPSNLQGSIQKAALRDGRVNCGAVTKLCIERFYEIFDTTLADAVSSSSHSSIHSDSDVVQLANGRSSRLSTSSSASAGGVSAPGAKGSPSSPQLGDFPSTAASIYSASAVPTLSANHRKDSLQLLGSKGGGSTLRSKASRARENRADVTRLFTNNEVE